MADDLKAAPVVTFADNRTIQAVVNDSGANDGKSRRMQLREGSVKAVNGPNGLMMLDGAGLVPAGYNLVTQDELDAAIGSGAKEPLQVQEAFSTATRFLLLTDDRKILRATHATPVLTIRTQANIVYPAGFVVTGTALNGMTIARETGVTINGGTASVTVGTEATGADFRLIRTASDTWIFSTGASSAAGGVDTPTTTRTALQAMSVDGTQGPLGGAAIMAAITSQVQASVRTELAALYAKANLKDLVVEGALAPASGNIAVFTSELATGQWSMTPTSTVGLAAVPLATLFTDANGLAYEVPYQTGEAWSLIRPPYTPTAKSFVSGQLTFDARFDQDGRFILASELSQNSTFSEACWTYIYDWEMATPAYVLVPIGPTPYTVLPASGVAGFNASEMPTFPPNSKQLFALTRMNGVPTQTWIASYVVAGAGGPAEDPSPQYIANIANTAMTSTVAMSQALPAGTAAGDTIVVFMSNANSAAMPTLPTINGNALTDSGLGGDANAPAVRTCWKQNLTAAEITAGVVATAGASGALQCRIATFRKAGSFPTIPALSTYSKQASGATTTVSWGAVTFTQDCLLLGYAQFLGSPSDVAALRPGVTELSIKATPSISTIGVSDLLIFGTDTMGATTTAKTGVAGRAVSVQVPVY